MLVEKLGEPAWFNTTSHSQSLATTHENKITAKGETERKKGKQVFETIILFEKVYLST